MNMNNKATVSPLYLGSVSQYESILLCKPKLCNLMLCIKSLTPNYSFSHPEIVHPFSLKILIYIV